MAKEKKQTFLFILILFTLILAVFLPSMEGEFLWDDKYFISENPSIQGPRFLKNFLLTPFGGQAGLDERSVSLGRVMPFYRPLVSLSYWLDLKLWGLNPAGFHFTNIFIHFLNTLVLCFILINLGIKPISSFFGSMLFAVFPLHFENVSWISGRTDLLSFLYASLCIYFFLKFLKKRHFLLLSASAFLYLCSLLSKENSIFLIAILFIFLYQKEKRFRDWIIPIIPFMISFLIWLILRNAALGSLTFSYSERTLQDLCATFGFYTFKTLFPFHLSISIDFLAVFNHTFFFIFGGLILLVSISSGFMLIKKNWPRTMPLLILFSFFLLLLPSVVIIFSASSVSYMAWRFIYLPSAVFVSVLAYWIFKVVRSRSASIICLSLLCLFYVAELYPKSRLFGKSETDFWMSLKDVEREDVVVKMNVGMKYLSRDEKVALEIFEKILSLKEHPLFEMIEARIYEELASYFTFRKDLKKAEYYFNKLLTGSKTQSQNFYFTYAYYLAFKGEKEEGAQIIVNMLDSFPMNHLVLTHAARFYIIINDFDRAIELLERDCQLFSNKQSFQLLNELKNLPPKR